MVVRVAKEAKKDNKHHRWAPFLERCALSRRHGILVSFGLVKLDASALKTGYVIWIHIQA